MDTNKEYDFNVDARSSRSVSTSMDKPFEEESTPNNSITEQAAGRKSTSRIRHKRKEYSPEVSVAPLYKRFSLSEDFSVIKDGAEPETSRSLLNTSRARNKNVVKRYSPASEKSSRKEKDDSTDSQKEVILLSHLGDLLKKKYSHVEDFSLDYRKLGVKVKDISPEYSLEPLDFKHSNSAEPAFVPSIPTEIPEKKTNKRTSSIKLKLPRKHSVEKLLKQEAQNTPKNEGESSKESSVVSQSTPDHLEMSSPSESSGRPKRLAAGKSRDFISQLVAPNRRHSKASEHATPNEREKSASSTPADVKSEEKEETANSKPVDTANIIREAEKIASALTELTSRPKRSLNLTPKMRNVFNLKGDKTGLTRSDFKITARPNSALDILRNAKLYQRVRSPSPINTSIPPVSKPATPPHAESPIDSKPEEKLPVPEDSVASPPRTPEDDENNDKDIKVEEVSLGIPEPEEEVMDTKLDESDAKEDEKLDSEPSEAPETAEATSISSAFQAKPGRSKGKLLNENDSPVKPIPEISAPVLPIKKVEPVRSSRRIIKPVKFEDFVTDHPHPKNERTASSSAASISDVPSSSEETPVELAKPAGRQRPRKSSISNKRKSEPQPIRLKLRLDGKRSSVIGGIPKVTSPEPRIAVEDTKQTSIFHAVKETTPLNDSILTNENVTPTEAERRGETKVKRKSGKSWILGYTPSVKPVLEDLVHTNGTVEKIGVVVYAVMDRILLEVCQDGVVRHSGAISKKDRRQRAMGIARQRYLEKKAEYEVLKAACLARGETPPVFSHTLTTHKRYSRSSLPSDADCLSSGRAERTKKGGIYKQNEYLMKTNKSRKFSESDDNEGKEPKSRKILEFSPIQQREPKEEKFLHEKRKRRADEYSGRNENDYYSHERIHEIREKQREKTVPFSMFLENKPEGLSQSLCINTPITSSQPHDFFYRDLLYGSRMTSVNTEYVDDVVDILENEKTEFNENDYVINSDAKNLAAHIGTLLMRPSQPDGSYSISDFFSLIREETELRRAIVNQAMDIITDQYVTEQVAYDVNANVTVYNTTLRNASLLRDIFNMFSEERQNCVYWVHRTFLETLPEHFLASYLILLRYCKTLTNSYIGKVIKNCANDSYPWPEVVELLTEFTNTKVVDPDLDMLNRTVTSCLLSDVVFLLVSPAISAGDFVLKARYHENVFRWLKQMGHPASEVMRMSFNEDYENYSVAQLCDTMIDKIVQKVKQLTKSHRDKRIVLVGWQTTCFFNHRAVQLTHGVSAIIDLAFPVLTTEGPRGSADDDILLTYCPSLFIAGSESEDFDAVAMRELRSHMIVPTGLVVVANADANLMVSNTVLNKLCITQKTVHRALVEQVNHFLRLDETRKERSQLIPVELNNVYHVDPSKFSAKDKQKLTSEKEEAARSKKKRFAGPFSPTAPAMPALSAEMTLSTSQARNRFDQMLKKSLPQHYDSRKVKEDATRKESFREPRAPPVSAGYKSSPLPSPSVRPSSTEASNLLDPALISLS
ncbi:unnamed protein product [Auanema sp. JU1783]|nr:unnamed protein product [Auanema sp. JU1783]